jgi:endoglucanase
MKLIKSIDRAFKLKYQLFFIVVFLVLACSSMPVRTTSQVDFNYGEVLQKSLVFYEAQQAGKLPEWNRVSWRGDSVTEDGADVGLDLSQGWFDAGDHVKFGFPMAASATTLAWGGIEYYDAYQQSGQLVHLTQNLKWVTDYFLKAFADDTPDNYVFYGQVGDSDRDHAWWGAAEVVKYEMERPSYKIDTTCPGSELAAETSAALAASSILFRRSGDTAYADLLVQKAEKLYDFADRYRGVYSDCLTAAASSYKSFSGYQDELVWGAIWLHKAKKAQNYGYSSEFLQKAVTEYQAMSKPYDYTFLTDDKSYGVYALLATETGEAEYQQRTEAWLDYWTIGYQGKKIKYTPGGLAFLVKWGSLNLAANTSFIGFIYSDWLRSRGEIEKADRYFNFGKSQIEYILGKNPANRSYIIGYGYNYPRNPHHRSAHGSWTNDSNSPAQSRNLLMGALVGGPDENDNWSDNRNDWVTNEVAIGYNAGFTGAVARMYGEFGDRALAEITFPKSEEKEIYVDFKINDRGKRAIDIDSKIINKSAHPARGLEKAVVRVFYTFTGNSTEKVTITSIANDCGSSSSQPVLIKDNTYYADLKCENTVIYPGGATKYQKRIAARLATVDRNWWGELTDIFSAPSIQVTDLGLYDNDELIIKSEAL